MRGPPRLYRLMYPRRVFTVGEAARAARLGRNQTLKQLSYLTTHGYLDRVRQGLYVIVPLKGEAFANPYLVASKLTRPYSLCYHSALELHGVAHSAYSRVQVGCVKQFAPVEYKGFSFGPERLPAAIIDKSRIRFTIEDQTVWCTDREWTFALCAAHPFGAGGLVEVLQSVAGFQRMDGAKLLEIAKDIAASMRKRVAFNRIGFILSRFQDRWRIPEAVLKLFQDHSKLQADALVSPEEPSLIYEDYLIMVPKYIERVIEGT